MGNVRKHRDIKFVTTKERKNYLVSEPNYQRKLFPENLLAIKTKKMHVFMNKPVYFGLSILEISKIVTHELLYDYVKPKYIEKAKLCYMDTDSFIICIKTKDI